MSERVYVVCPGDYLSGGPELCHQLVHQLNQSGTDRARIVYFPFDRVFEVPVPYRHYSVRPARSWDVQAGSTVVLPEVYGDYVTWFAGCRTYFWWLSVGNFITSAGRRAPDQIAVMRRNVSLHLYQSEHARLFLRTMKLGPAARLSDHLSDGYIAAIADPPGWDRHNLVLYNPAKGPERTESILAELKRRQTGYDLVPLQGFTTTEMRRLLGRAKLYIDFGEHPGKDRIPREAAAMGACVLTNRRGAAGSNPLDVPIPADLKINDRRPGFERRAADKICAVIDGFDPGWQSLFDGYRKIIAAEPGQFAADVEALFPVKVTA